MDGETFDAFLVSDTETNNRSMEICRIDSLPSSETLRVLDLTMCDLARLAPVAFPRLATPLRLRLSTVHPTYLEALPKLATVRLEYVLFTVRAAPAATPLPVVVRLSLQTVTELVLASCGVQNSNSWAVEVDTPRLSAFSWKGCTIPPARQRPWPLRTCSIAALLFVTSR